MNFDFPFVIINYYFVTRCVFSFSFEWQIIVFLTWREFWKSEILIMCFDESFQSFLITLVFNHF